MDRNTDRQQADILTVIRQTDNKQTDRQTTERKKQKRKTKTNKHI
jgi:hypothetical protein